MERPGEAWSEGRCAVGLWDDLWVGVGGQSGLNGRLRRDAEHLFPGGEWV